MPAVRSSYGSGGNLSTSMEREGVDIGPIPDFWSELNAIRTRLGPVQATPRQTAASQAAALRQAPAYPPAAPSYGGLSAAPASRPDDDYEYVPYFGTLTYPHGSAGFYQNYQPGMPLGTGQQPVAMGVQRVRRR